MSILFYFHPEYFTKEIIQSYALAEVYLKQPFVFQILCKVRALGSGSEELQNTAHLKNRQHKTCGNQGKEQVSILNK